MANRTLVRALLGAGLLLAGWGAWQLGHGLMGRRLELPDDPAARPAQAPVEVAGAPAEAARATPIASTTGSTRLAPAARRAPTGRSVLVTGHARDGAGLGVGRARVGAVIWDGRPDRDEPALATTTADETGAYALTVTDLPVDARLAELWICAKSAGTPVLRGLARTSDGRAPGQSEAYELDLVLTEAGVLVAHVVAFAPGSAGPEPVPVPSASLGWRGFDPDRGHTLEVATCDASGTARLEAIGQLIELIPIAPGYEAIGNQLGGAPPGKVVERTVGMWAVPGRLELIVRDEQLRALPEAEVVVERDARGRSDRRRGRSGPDGKVVLEGFRIGEVLRLISAGAPDGLADPTLGSAADGSGGPAASEWTIPESRLATGEVFVRRAARVRGRLHMVSGRPVGAGIGVEIAGRPGAITDARGEFESTQTLPPGEHTLLIDIAPQRLVELRAGLNELDVEVPDAFLLRLRPIWADTKRPVFDGTRLDPVTVQVAAEVHFGEESPLGVLHYEPATGTMAGWVPLDEGTLRVGLLLVRTPPRTLVERAIARRPAPGETLDVELPIAVGEFGRVAARIHGSQGVAESLPLDARLRPKDSGSDLPPRYARVGERGQLDLEFVDPGIYLLDVAAFPKSGRWEVTVEAGKTTDLGDLTLPGS